MIVRQHVVATMRDGTRLSADVYRPESEGRCVTILVRTCYTKWLGDFPKHAAFWTSNGFAYVVQDVRGRGDSDGQFYPFAHEREDGSDSIDWIVAQPWSDGRVVMLGGSYLALTQLYAAGSLNRHLVAIVPMSAPSDPDRGFPTCNGMVLPSAALWLATLNGNTNQDLSTIDVAGIFAHWPVISLDTAMGRRLEAWREWIERLGDEPYWEGLSYQRRLGESSQDMLHITGWYDDCLQGSLENFSTLSTRQKLLGDEAPSQALIVGPWTHTGMGERRIGDLDFGANAEVDFNQVRLSWLSARLRKEPSDRPPVRLFVMGRNAWLEGHTWPLAETQYLKFFLHSAGRANTRLGDGALSMRSPGDEPPDSFDFDPTTPVPYSPSLEWRQVGGADECGTLEMRDDVLVYSTA